MEVHYETQCKIIRFVKWIGLGNRSFLIDLVDNRFDGVTGEPTLIGRLYRGYNISPTGSIIGLAWAFFDGLIIGAIFAWLYNVLSDRFIVRKT